MNIFLRFLLLVMIPAALAGPAYAACVGNACVSSGPRLASMDSREATLYNGVTSQLTDSNVSLGVADWNALAQGGTNMGLFLDALAAETGVAGRDEALAGSATMSQIVAAMATAARQEGRTEAAAALDALRSQVSGLSGTVQVGDLVDTGGGTAALDAVSVGTLDLVTGLVQLYNFDNASAAREPLLLTGESLGIADTVQAVRLSAQTTEPPVFRCGPQGTTFHSAAMRLKLDVDLAPQSPDVSALTAVIPGISAAQMSLSSLTIYGETARGSGVISAIDAAARSVTVEATPGAADLYLGRIADSVFYDRTRRIDPAVDLDFAPIGELRLTDAVSGEVTAVAVEARSHAAGQAPSTSTLFFSEPYPQTQTAGSSLAANMAADLMNNLEVRTTPDLGANDEQARATLLPIVMGALTPATGVLVTQALDPAFKQMGIGFGEMDVTVDSVGGGCGISGRVYADANHDGRRAADELAMDATCYAKLLPAGQGGPALQVVAVDAASGVYRFAAVAPGDYDVVINRDADAASVAPQAPAGWLATAPSPPRRDGLTLADAELTDQDFGFYAGARVSGSVFRDSGAAANDGVRQEDEAGMAGVAVAVTDAAGGTVFDQAASDGDGAWTLWVPAAAGNGTLKIVERNPGGHLSTGAETGSTGGSYERAADAVSFSPVPGSDYRGVNFGDVPLGHFDTDGRQSALPGSVLFYSHAFTAGSRGGLSVSAAARASPENSGWNTVLYRDADCNGAVDAGDAPLAATVALLPEEKLCLVAKVFVPANAPFAAQHQLTLSAAFSHDNAQEPIDFTLSRQDLTLVGTDQDAALRLTKRADKTEARPGDTIVYRVSFRNDGAGALDQLRIRDATPPYTVFVAAACGDLPAGATACAVAKQPAADRAGSIEWRIDGAIQAGAVGEVSFTVRLE